MLNLRFAIRGEVTGASQEILILHTYLGINLNSAYSNYPPFTLGTERFQFLPYLRAIKIYKLKTKMTPAYIIY